MTPEQRRAKYPLPAVKPLSMDELVNLQKSAAEWLLRPAFTSGTLDRDYHTVARLIATIERVITQPLVWGVGAEPEEKKP